MELQVAWHLLYGMEQFADELSAYSQRPPRVWRANFYRTNFFSTGHELLMRSGPPPTATTNILTATPN